MNIKPGQKISIIMISFMGITVKHRGTVKTTQEPAKRGEMTTIGMYTPMGKRKLIPLQVNDETIIVEGWDCLPFADGEVPVDGHIVRRGNAILNFCGDEQLTRAAVEGAIYCGKRVKDLAVVWVKESKAVPLFEEARQAAYGHASLMNAIGVA